MDNFTEQDRAMLAAFYDVDGMYCRRDNARFGRPLDDFDARTLRAIKAAAIAKPMKVAA